MDQSDFLHFDITGKVIGALQRVYGKLGAGLPRDFYQNALTHDLTQNNSQVSQSHPIDVSYDDAVVGELRADLLVDELVMILIASYKPFNFGDKLDFRRKICSNGNKARKMRSG
jgi:GxxExxY protein